MRNHPGACIYNPRMTKLFLIPFLLWAVAGRHVTDWCNGFIVNRCRLESNAHLSEGLSSYRRVA